MNVYDFVQIINMMACDVALIINVVAIFVFYWMKRKQKDRRTYYTDRFNYIRNKLTERLREVR